MAVVRTFRRAVLLAGVGAVAAAAACTEPSPLPRLWLGYDAKGSYADPALFRAEVTHDGQRQVFGPAQLTVRSRTEGRVQASIGDLRLDAGESITVRIAVVADGDTAAAGSVSWTVEKDWSYSVTGVVGDRPPQGFCVISVSAAGELPPRGRTSGDSLFVVRSGLKKNTVC